MVRDAPVLRPAGQSSEFRSVAAMMSLRLLGDADFRDIAGGWIGNLFQEGHLYRNSSSSMPMICLGFHYKVAFFWHVLEVGEGWFKLSEHNLEACDAQEAASKFEPVCLTSVNKAGEDCDDAWKGIPVSVCDLASQSHPSERSPITLTQLSLNVFCARGLAVNAAMLSNNNKRCGLVCFGVVGTNTIRLRFACKHPTHPQREGHPASTKGR